RASPSSPGVPAGTPDTASGAGRAAMSVSRTRARCPAGGATAIVQRSSNLGSVMNQRILQVMAWLLNPPLSAPRVTTLIRVMVGAVFLAEAIMKFVFPDTLGPGRFGKLGLPAPEIMSPFDAVFEAGCGILL